MQAFRMFAAFENLAVIGALAFEDGAGIMQRVGQDMYIRLAPVHEFPIHPDRTIAIIIAGHSLSPFDASLFICCAHYVRNGHKISSKLRFATSSPLECQQS